MRRHSGRRRRGSVTASRRSWATSLERERRRGSGRDGRSAARRVDAAFNVAGIGDLAPIVEMPEELWDRVMNVTLKGVFFSIKHEARAMIRRGGAIVNVASINRQPTAGLTAYATAKAGVDMLTRSAAVELGEHGIRGTPCPRGSSIPPPPRSSSRDAECARGVSGDDSAGALRGAERHRGRRRSRRRRRRLGLGGESLRGRRRIADWISQPDEACRRGAAEVSPPE